MQQGEREKLAHVVSPAVSAMLVSSHCSTSRAGPRKGWLTACGSISGKVSDLYDTADI